MNEISLCMIVKNEEKFLPACLDSVKDAVDEIIIVDTGSTDKTKDIVHSFQSGLLEKKTGIQVPSASRSDLMVRLYETIWNDDFAAARNESLRYATKDWILTIDADEIFSDESKPLLKELVQKENTVAFLANMYLLHDDNQKSAQVSKIFKLFRNHLGLEFAGRVHEQITDSLESLLKTNPAYQTESVNLNFYHFGYIKDKEKINEKAARNIMLAAKALQESQQQIDKWIYYQLTIARNLLVFNKRNEALALYRLVVQILKKENSRELWTKQINSELFTQLIQLYLEEQKTREAFDLLEYALKFFPDLPTFYYYLGRAFIQIKEYPKAISALSICLKLKENKQYSKELPFDPALLDAVPYCAIGFCYMKLGKKEKAEQLLRQSLKYRPGFAMAVKLLEEITKNGR